MNSTIWDALLSHWRVEASETVGDYKISILINRRDEHVRIAWRGPAGFRWHLSPYTTMNFARTLLNFASQDRREGRSEPTVFLHRFRIYSREVTPSRWTAHKRRMAEYREAKALERIAGYGMF